MEYVNTYGLYQCFQGTNDEMVAPECREDFFAIQPIGKIFHCISEQDDAIILRYGEQTFRVNPELYRILSQPLYNVGDNIEIINKAIKGKIADVNWHFKKNAPFYFIEINGKKDRKRYWDCDLKAVRVTCSQ